MKRFDQGTMLDLTLLICAALSCFASVIINLQWTWFDPIDHEIAIPESGSLRMAVSLFAVWSYLLALSVGRNKRLGPVPIGVLGALLSSLFAVGYAQVFTRFLRPSDDLRFWPHFFVLTLMGVVIAAVIFGAGHLLSVAMNRLITSRRFP